MILNRNKDAKPYIEVKDVIVARSGIYRYTRDEILARGHKPAKVKDFYLEYRPPAVIVDAIPLFDLVPVPNQEHTDVEITPDNFHDLTSGIIGGPITAVAMPDGHEIGLKGRIAFFTKAAYDYYKGGNVETSADYVSESSLVDNPDEVGYDLIVNKILSVNNVAITAHGRGGKDVRIHDSAAAVESVEETIRRRSSMGIISHILGFGEKPKDTFAAEVKDSLVKAKTMTAEQRSAEVERIMSFVSPFTDSDAKSALIGVVRDSFVFSEKILEKWKESEVVLNNLYARCTDAEAALAASVKDEKSGDEEDEKKKKEEDEKKKAQAKDAADAAAAAAAGVKDAAALVDAKISELSASIPGMIDAGIKKALGLTGGAGDPQGGQGGGRLDRVNDSIDSSSDDIDFATKDAFGTSKR